MFTISVDILGGKEGREGKKEKKERKDEGEEKEKRQVVLEDLPILLQSHSKTLVD